MRTEHGTTKLGVRWLALPAWLADALAARWETRTSDTIVFPNPLDPRLYREVSLATKKLRGVFDGVVGEDGEPLTWASSHVFRRTVVTTAHDLGVVDRQIAGQTGHRSTETMRRRYVAKVRKSTLAADLLVDDPTALVDEADAPSSRKAL